MDAVSGATSGLILQSAVNKQDAQLGIIKQQAEQEKQTAEVISQAIEEGGNANPSRGSLVNITV